MTFDMPRPSRLKLSPLPLASESFGRRLARIRKEKGLTQTELAQKTGLIQTLISAYENDQLRLRADVAVRFALALHVTTDELLGLKKPKESASPRTARLVHRLRRIEELPAKDQKQILDHLEALLLKNANGRQYPRRTAAVGS